MVVSLMEQQHIKDDPEYGDTVMGLQSRICKYKNLNLFNSRVIKSVNLSGDINMGNKDNINATAIMTINELHEVLNIETLEKTVLLYSIYRQVPTIELSKAIIVG
jgi:hypothetical protein